MDTMQTDNKWLLSLDRQNDDCTVYTICLVILFVTCHIHLLCSASMCQGVREARPSKVLRHYVPSSQWCAWGPPSWDQGADPWDWSIFQLIQDETEVRNAWNRLREKHFRQQRYW